MPWPLAILFDFDGVIVNSEPLHFEAFQTVLAEEQIALTRDEYFDELIGYDDRGAFARVFELRQRHLDPRTFLRVMTRKSEAMMELIESRRYSALRGVEELVRGLWRHYPLAIVSGALREEIEAMLAGIALRDCFSLIIAAEDVEIGKPDPQGYLRAVDELNHKAGKIIHPHDCLIVEDAPPVIARVRQKGFKTLAIPNSHSVESLAHAGADWIVRTLEPDVVWEKLPDLKTNAL